jgi:hypothetical protein
VSRGPLPLWLWSGDSCAFIYLAVKGTASELFSCLSVMRDRDYRIRRTLSAHHSWVHPDPSGQFSSHRGVKAQ